VLDGYGDTILGSSAAPAIRGRTGPVRPWTWPSHTPVATPSRSPWRRTPCPATSRCGST